MIITIKGAKYTNNIGALDSWLISRSIGSGATYDGVTSVKKGESFSATVTINEGYEIGSAGITVTMGGEDITDRAVLTRDEVIVISIAPVTGNVVITVPTKNTATGEEDEPENPGGGEVVDPETPDNPDTEMGLTYKLNRNIDTTGIIHPYNGRIAVADFIETNGETVTVTHSGGLSTAIRYYDADKVYTSDATASTYCRIVVITENSGDKDITGTALTNDTVKNTTLTINGTVYTLTNKVEETQLMYFVNTNFNNKIPYLQQWNERITIDDGFWTNGTAVEVTYNGSKFTTSTAVAKRYFNGITYTTTETSSTNVRCVIVGTGGLTTPESGSKLAENLLDGETLTVNDTVYTFI